MAASINWGVLLVAGPTIWGILGLLILGNSYMNSETRAHIPDPTIIPTWYSNRKPYSLRSLGGNLYNKTPLGLEDV